MSKQESMKESRTGNGLMSRGDFVKVVFNDGDKTNALRGTVVGVDNFFITIHMTDKKTVSIAKEKITKIVKYSKVIL